VVFDRYADLQVLVVDTRANAVVARGRTIPFRWDGSLDDLPHGFDDALGARAVEDSAPPTALSALSAEVHPEFRGQRLSRVVIEAMAAAARVGGLSPLVAPVRPMWKDRYPITPRPRLGARSPSRRRAARGGASGGRRRRSRRRLRWERSARRCC